MIEIKYTVNQKQSYLFFCNNFGTVNFNNFFTMIIAHIRYKVYLVALIVFSHYLAKKS